MEVEVHPKKDTILPQIVVEEFLRNQVVGLTHEAFDKDDNKVGEIDINTITWEIDDDTLSKMQKRQPLND